MTLQEMLAGAEAQLGIGRDTAFTSLYEDAQEDKFNIEGIGADYDRQADQRGAQIIRQKEKAGTAGLLGAIAGGLLGTAFLNPVLGARVGTTLGAGLGSFAGRKLSGDLSLDKITDRGGQGVRTFYQGAQERLADKKKDLNKFLQNAEGSFKRMQLVDSLKDAYSAYSLSGDKAFSKLFNRGDKTVPGLMNAPTMSYAGTEFDLERLIGRNPLDIAMEDMLSRRIRMAANNVPQGVYSMFGKSNNPLLRGSAFDNSFSQKLPYIWGGPK